MRFATFGEASRQNSSGRIPNGLWYSTPPRPGSLLFGYKSTTKLGARVRRYMVKFKLLITTRF
eukprot:323486-Amorphochlora_amoeboformis.AAC.1